MKIPKNKRTDSKTEENVSRQTKVTELTGETVKIWHTQSVRQSSNYQSAEASYGVEMIVPNTRKAIRKGIHRCEAIVEDPMTEKVTQQQTLLGSLAAVNR